ASLLDGVPIFEVAIGDGGGDVGDVAHLVGQVIGHRVDAVGEVLPGAGDAFDLGLPAQPPLGAYFSCDPGYFRGEGVKLIHHGVDGVFQLQYLAAYFDGDLLGEVSVGDGCGHVGDVAHVAGQVISHKVD